MVDIRGVVLSDGLAAVEAACAAALEDGPCSADVILNRLARARRPASPPAILTPASLALSHTPVADCRRYDALRDSR